MSNMNITDMEAVHLLINTYMIKQLNSAGTIVEEKEFIEFVQKIFVENNMSYPREQILITWRQLLEKYYYFKENLSMKQACDTWPFFSLMDTCFEESKSKTYRFSDPNLTFNLIKCMSDYKQILLNHGLTMNILRNVEKKLKILENNINQRDIYIQWTNLKKCYEEKEKQIQSHNRYSEFLEAMELYIYNAKDSNSGSNSKRPLYETGEVSTKKIRKLDSDLGENLKNLYNCNFLKKEESVYDNSSNKKECTIMKGNEDVGSLLRRHENSYRELAELKEVLLENNLLRKESKYLLNLFSDKIKSRSIELK